MRPSHQRLSRWATRQGHGAKQSIGRKRARADRAAYNKLEHTVAERETALDFNGVSSVLPRKVG
jgi:hypothetical protein